jgi:phosphopantothenoylcysteine decarboxylase/phosphopantothenate--cysteine ligase
MEATLRGKKIVLGVTGSIAAYKAVDVARQLSRAGAEVDVVMTEEAGWFVAPLSFRALTGRAVVTGMVDSPEFIAPHVVLAKADAVVIAPATANIIARLALGIADDVLCCTVLATTAPVVIAPAMESHMYENPVTQENISRLKGRGFIFVGPEFGRLASGGEGPGRFANSEDIVGVVLGVLGRKGDLAGRKVVVTAGGTREPVDPVRCITNRSSGKMGYALAEAARDRGAEVTLITAPTSLARPAGVEVVDVGTAEDMLGAVKRAVLGADALVMAAAVTDYRPRKPSGKKIKKSRAGLTLELELTPDILSEVKGSFVRVGFAAESEKLVVNARKKLKQKSLDLIVANDITAPDSGFGVDTNRVTIVDKEGKVDSLPLMSKRAVAERVLDRVAGRMGKFSDEVIVRISAEKSHYIKIPKAKEYLFPNSNIQLNFNSGIGIIKVNFRANRRGKWLWKKHLAGWFKQHDLNPRDKFVLIVSEPMKKYRLEIVK